MGGCYSSAGEKYLPPPHKSPTKRSTHSSNQGTKEPLLPPDSNGKPGHTSCSPDLTPTDQEQRPVVASDSGIGSLGSHQDDAHAELVEKVCTKCQQPFNRGSLVICPECGHPRVVVGEGLPLPSGDVSQPKPENYCSCGPRHAGKQNYQETVCKTHLNSPKPQRHSDIFSSSTLKSSFKKEARFLPEHKARLSWKSADSLDVGASMTTPMDRCRSEVSEIFGDDISLRAPLAAFDSVDGTLDRDSETGAKARQQQNSSVSMEQSAPRGMCMCESENFARDLVQEVDKMLAKTLEEERSLSAELKRMDSEGGSDDAKSPAKKNGAPGNEEMLKPTHQTVATACLARSSVSSQRPSDPRLSTSSLASLGSELETVTRDGQDFVLIDVETFSQILQEVAVMKEELGQLTAVIQEAGHSSDPFQNLDGSFVNQIS